MPRIFLLILLIPIILLNCTHIPDYLNYCADELPVEFFPDILNSSTIMKKDSPFGIKLNSYNYILNHRPKFNRWFKLLTEMSDSNHSRWKTNKDVTIVFLGGSMTIGHGINDPPRSNITSFCNHSMATCVIDSAANNPCIQCAFPERFRYWLQHVYPYLNIKVYNLARGGVNTEGIAGTIDQSLKDVPGHIDMILLNYVDNDRGHGVRPGNIISAAFERLIRYLMMYTNTTIVDMEMRTQSPTHEYAPHEGVLHHYLVPTVNYDKMTHEKLGMKARHPPWPYHQLTANVLAYMWQQVDVVRIHLAKTELPTQL